MQLTIAGVDGYVGRIAMTRVEAATLARRLAEYVTKHDADGSCSTELRTLHHVVLGIKGLTQ